jgi:hypothetical protein
MSSNNRNRQRAGGVGMAVSAAFAAALAFSAATAQAAPDYPTPIGDGFNVTDCCVIGPWGALENQYYQDFSVPNDPADTFEGLVREDSPFFGFSGIASDNNVYVERDISGNVPVGEQYNSLNFGGPGSAWLDGFHLVYDNIGGTPEAAFITPFGDLNFPTSFVDLLGPSFFEPSFYTEAPVLASPVPAAELIGLANAPVAGATPDAEPASTVPSLGDPPPADLDPFQDLFGDTGINSWTPAADSYLASIDPTNALATNFDASVDNFVTVAGPPYFYGPDLVFSELAYGSDPSAFSIPIPMIEFLTPVDSTGEFALGLDYTMYASGLAPVVDPLIMDLVQASQLPQELLALLVILDIPFGI